ncbi:hypothetical protein CDD83_10051 [Cordyceps sp. RAO-2017]|nr:hypothetical protein CDD83_10051 [Cordyceps sp. RAO-2017]
MATRSRDSRLESLPPEVRRQLLSVLGLEELVLACPAFHAQYLLNRRFLLGGCLEATLGPLAVDAWAAHQSGKSDFDRSLGKDTLARFSDAYRRWRCAGPAFSLLAEGLADKDDVAGVAAFHIAVVRPLARRYAD